MPTSPIDPRGVEGLTPELAGAATSGELARRLDVLERRAQPPWIAPTLLNSWVNYGGSFAAAGYYRHLNGIVRLKGLVASGAAASIIFVLPVGYRPLEQHLFAVIGANAIARVDIRANGDVFLDNGNNAFVSLSGISFRAEA